MKSNIKKYIIEGSLIVFSVFFALLINKMFDAYQLEQKKDIALQGILKELYRNEAIIASWKDKHTSIRDKITSIVNGENDSLKVELKKYKFLNLGVLTDNQSLIDAIITNTAWESAKNTGIISEFDFETTQKLTHVYLMQEELTEKTVRNILNYYFDAHTHQISELGSILIQLQLRFWELTGQEELLTQFYSEAIEQLKK